MSKRVKLLGIALMLTVAVSMLAADASYPGVGKVRSIHFLTPMKVGGVVLAAGYYKVQRLQDGENHVLVFKTSDNKQEKVRVHCRLAELARKVWQTEQVEMQNDAGEHVLESVAFEGDKFRHEIATQ